jgi:hypothetical protein
MPEEKPCKSGPYGEHGCGVHDDTDAVRHMLELGFGVPRGTYMITGPIKLPVEPIDGSEPKA